MRVFENHYHRLLACQTLELSDQRFQGLLLFSLWIKVEQGLAPQWRQ